MDTLRLTQNNASPDILCAGNGENWELKLSDTGELHKQTKTLYLNQSDTGAYNGTIRIEYDHVKNYLNVGVSSVPALLYGTSLTRVKPEDVARVSDAINGLIAPYVDFDVSLMKVSRYDSDTLYDMDAPAPAFIVLLDAITRNQQRAYHKQYYQGETLQFRNHSQTVGFYDKALKNKLNEVERAMNFTPAAGNMDNKLRYEIQMKKAKVIRSVAGAPLCLRDACTDQVQQTFVDHRKKMFDVLFSTTDKTALQMAEAIADVFSQFHSEKPKTALSQTALYLMLRQGIISTSIIDSIYHSHGYSRATIAKRRKQMGELVSRDMPHRELYKELKNKIYNDTI